MNSKYFKPEQRNFILTLLNCVSICQRMLQVETAKQLIRAAGSVEGQLQSNRQGQVDG